MMHCNYCPNTTTLTEAGARSIGWRVFRGNLQGGVDAIEDVACPTCSGRSAGLKAQAFLSQDALFPAEPVIDTETVIGKYTPDDWIMDPWTDPRWERCITEIADGLEDAAGYAGGSKSNSGRTMLHYARRIRELLVGDHESCNSHD